MSSADDVDVNDEELKKATIQVNDKELERATIQCDACNLPTHVFTKVNVVERDGKFNEERWCPKCSLQAGEKMRDQKEDIR
jgi:hypothetical protein